MLINANARDHDTTKIQLGVFITHANDLLGHNLSGLLTASSIIDESGIDYLVVADHVVLGMKLDGHSALGGNLPFPIDEPYPEPLVTLSAIAAVTRNVRLATGILIAPLRPAALLAKMAATVAVISNGRLDLGVGSGWQQEEFDALGVPMEGKVERMDDSIDACRALWSQRTATFHSPSVSFDDVSCAPRPPGNDVPLWFAGRSIPATLRRVVRSGTGWLPLGLPEFEELERVKRQFLEFSDEAGRKSDIGIRVTLPTKFDASGESSIRLTIEKIAELSSLGVTGVQVNIRDFAHSMDELKSSVEELRSYV